jgi:hypothetical protein
MRSTHIPTQIFLLLPFTSITMGKGNKARNATAKPATKVMQSGKAPTRCQTKKIQKLQQRQDRNKHWKNQTQDIMTIIEETSQSSNKEQELAEKQAREKEQKRTELRAALEREKATTAKQQAATKVAQEEKTKHVEEMAVTKEAEEMVAVNSNKEMAKRKVTHESTEEFVPGPRIRLNKMKDRMTLSPLKKKQCSNSIQFQDKEVNDESLSSAESSELETFKVVPPPAEKSIVAPKPILCTSRPSMLEKAKEGIEEGVSPFFAPGNSGQNKEGIPPADYSSVVFIEPTIMVPPKPNTFKGTDMKWALQQFSDWFTEAQEQLEPEGSLILLVHRMLHRLEPEAMKDVVKYLKGMQNTISKHVSNFWVNTKMAGEGKSYPMYLKLRIDTNVFGDKLTHLIQVLRSISLNVTVWKSTLQKADVVTLGWWKNTHRNFHLPWITNWANNIAIQLSAGTCKNTLPGLDKDILKGRDPIELGFQWKAVQDGYNKDSWVKAGRKQYYPVHVLAEKKDKSLANVLVNVLIISPSLFCNSALEFRMAPLYQRENGPAEKQKFLESLKEHAYLQEHLMSVTIPDLLSLDIRAPVMEDQTQTEDNPDDPAMAIAEKWNPTARICIMSICKKGMPGVPLFTDIGTSFFITFAVSFKEEATFVAANMAAILFPLKREVGRSFLPDYVRSAVRKQGWNESEDHPVTSGELQLDDTLKPYAETSNMRKLFKFDFSEMDDTLLKEDLQQSSRPDKDGVPEDKHKSTRNLRDCLRNNVRTKMPSLYRARSPLSLILMAPDGLQVLLKESPMVMILLKVRIQVTTELLSTPKKIQYGRCRSHESRRGDGRRYY